MSDTIAPPPTTVDQAPAVATIQEAPAAEEKKTSENQTAEDGDEKWKPPSKRCSKEELKLNHRHHVRYPEEWTVSKFGFAQKPTEKGTGGHGKKVYINHKDDPFRGTQFNMHVILPLMRVSYAGETQDETTLQGKGFKMSLSADSSLYYQEGNDHHNLVTFAEALDDHVLKHAFENKDVWFKGVDANKVEEERDIRKIYMPIADYGAVGGDHPNPWVDENGNVVDPKKFEGKKHRQYGPKFWFGLSKTGSTQNDKWVWNDNEFDCEFLDGYTGKQMDITPKNFKAFMEANENIKAQGVYKICWVQLLPQPSFKIKQQLVQVYFFPKSSRPTTMAEPLPKGLGLSIQVPETPKGETEATEVVKEEDANPVVTGEVTIADSAPSAAAAEVKSEPAVTATLEKTSEAPDSVVVTNPDAQLDAGTMLPAPQNDAEYVASLKRSTGAASDEKKSVSKKHKSK